MSFSPAPPVESRIQFSPLPQHVDNHNIQVEDRHMVIEPCEERFDWDSLVMMLRLALVGTLLVGLALRQRQLDQPTSNPLPPKFFLDALRVPHFKVSDGELSSTWEVTLAISNVMNSSKINIQRLDAAMCYKENETLALTTPIMPQYAFEREVFPLEGEEMKRVHLKLNTTGWEKDQPIVDDTVIQAIAQDMHRGVTGFSLHLRVMGEVESGDGWVAAFAMYPKCTDLRVQFVAANQPGGAATLIDPKPRECVGLSVWGQVKDSL